MHSWYLDVVFVVSGLVVHWFRPGRAGVAFGSARVTAGSPSGSARRALRTGRKLPGGVWKNVQDPPRFLKKVSDPSFPAWLSSRGGPIQPDSFPSATSIATPI